MRGEVVEGVGVPAGNDDDEEDSLAEVGEGEE